MNVITDSLAACVHHVVARINRSRRTIAVYVTHDGELVCVENRYDTEGHGEQIGCYTPVAKRSEILADLCEHVAQMAERALEFDGLMYPSRLVVAGKPAAIAAN